MTSKELLDFFEQVRVGDLVESSYHPYIKAENINRGIFKEAVVVAKSPDGREVIIFNENWEQDLKGHSACTIMYYKSPHARGNWIISYKTMLTYGGTIRFSKTVSLIETDKDYADLFV